MKIKHFVFSPFQENTYVLYDDTHSCVVIDPGCFDRSEKSELEQFISDHNLKVERLLNTHCHLDHVCGNRFVSETYGVKPEMHAKDLPTLAIYETSAHAYGIRGMDVPPDEVSYLEVGETITFGQQSLDILFVPGHAPGHIAFYHQESQSVFSGDVLFQGSIGRTDLPGGNHETLLKSVREEIFTLPEETTVYSGHGPETTVGHEKRTNPFFA